MSALLPDGPELRGWQKDGAYQSFKGEDLFIYIDGGAEIYFEYGFERVIIQDYKDNAGGRLSLEVFEMNSPESAYGMFTFKKSPRGETVALGDECRLADYYLNFYKGRYLVTITSLGRDSVGKGALVALARVVEMRLSERGQPPPLVSLLPEEGRDPLSLMYFKGPLALHNTYPFFREDVFAFQKGIKCDYATGHSLFLLEYPAEETAARRFSEVRGRFSSEKKYKEVRWDGVRLRARDSKGKSIIAGQSGRYIIVVVGNDNQKEAEALLVRAEKRLVPQEEE